jgi:hypothetical protein
MLTLPTTVTVPQGSTSGIFTASTASVSSNTYVSANATFNGKTVPTSALLYPAPPLALSSVWVPIVGAGGNTVQGQVALTTAPLSTLVTVNLSSNNAAVIVPSSVTIPVGSSVVSFPVTTTVVNQPTTAVITASYAGVSVTAPVTLNPSVAITAAEYWTKSLKINITATTSVATAVLTFGSNVNGPALGTMTLSKGTFKGTASLSAAPAVGVVWSSTGGMATMPITLINK